MRNISINTNLLYLLFFLHPLIYIFDGDVYRNYEVLAIFIFSLISFKSLKSINFLQEKRFLLFFYIFILFQQFFIENRDFEFGIKFFITFLIATIPFWLFENITCNTKTLSKIIEYGINIIFYISLLNYFLSFLFNFGEVYDGGLFMNKRAFGILGDSFTPILNFLQIYYLSNKNYLKFISSILLLLITGGKAGIFMSITIIIADFFIKKKYHFKYNFLVLLILIVLAFFIAQFININNLILASQNAYNNRIISFELGINYFLDSPLLGIGINSGLLRAFDDSIALTNFYGIENISSVWQVQNTFIRLLSETGIFGILLIICIFSIWIKKIIYCINKSKNNDEKFYQLIYSTSIWLISFFITYQGIAWFVPGHPIFAWVLMFLTLNNIFIKMEYE